MKFCVWCLFPTILIFSPSKSSAQYTYIPDSNFEQELIEQGIDDDGLNGKVKTANISEIETFGIDFGNHLIKNLTGIEDFTSLKWLFIDGTRVSHLDLSKNHSLEWLSATFCQISSLNVTGCNQLKHLLLVSNNLTTLDLSSLTALEVLNASANPLIDIEVSKNLNLISLGLANSPIKSISTIENKKLQHLYCSMTPLKKLDVSHNTQLISLECSQTPNLHTICVPDAMLANSSDKFVKDSTDIWVDDCHTITSLHDVDKTFISKIYPNPTNGNITIEVEDNAQITISDILGREVLNTAIQAGATNIQLTEFEIGLYVIRIQTDNQQTKHLIKVE